MHKKSEAFCDEYCNLSAWANEWMNERASFLRRRNKNIDMFINENLTYDLLWRQYQFPVNCCHGKWCTFQLVWDPICGKPMKATTMRKIWLIRIYTYLLKYVMVERNVREKTWTEKQMLILNCRQNHTPLKQKIYRFSHSNVEHSGA